MGEEITDQHPPFVGCSAELSARQSDENANFKQVFVLKTHCVYVLNDSVNSSNKLAQCLHKVLDQTTTSTLARKLAKRIHNEGVACVYESRNISEALCIHQLLMSYGLTLVPFGEKPHRRMPRPEYWLPRYGTWRGMDA